MKEFNTEAIRMQANDMLKEELQDNIKSIINLLLDNNEAGLVVTMPNIDCVDINVAMKGNYMQQIGIILAALTALHERTRAPYSEILNDVKMLLDMLNPEQIGAVS